MSYTTYERPDPAVDNGNERDPTPALENCSFLLLTLAVGLGGIVTLVDDEVLGPVVFTAREVRLEDGLSTSGVSLKSC